MPQSQNSNSPSCSRSKNGDECDGNHMIRHRSFAPALEHRDNSNKEQEDRADRKNLEQH